MSTRLPTTRSLRAPHRFLAGALLLFALLLPEVDAATVVKDVYLGNTGAFSRTRSTSTTAVQINGKANCTTTAPPCNSTLYTLSPTTAGALTLAAGNITVRLQMARVGGNANRTVRVVLDTTGGTVTTLGEQTVAAADWATTVSERTFTINLAAPVALAANTALRLRVYNNTTNNTRHVTVRPFNTPNYSRVSYNADTFINVDSVLVYTAAYPSTSADTGIDAGSTGYIRAVVSDPFGDYDIEPTTDQAVLTITGPAAAPGPVNMTNVGADGSTLTKTFEYAWVVPGGQTAGIYTATVDADEGVEGTVSDSGVNAAIGVGTASLSLTRLSTAFSDPVNSMASPKRIPGSIVTHTVTGQNDGNGKADTVVVYEELSATSAYDVAYGVVFNAGTSGLTAPTVTYSTNACASFVDNLTPTGPYDATVRCIRIQPGGTIARNSGTPPSFTVSYRARVP